MFLTAGMLMFYGYFMMQGSKICLERAATATDERQKNALWVRAVFSRWLGYLALGSGVLTAVLRLGSA